MGICLNLEKLSERFFLGTEARAVSPVNVPVCSVNVPVSPLNLPSPATLDLRAPRRVMHPP